jgi:pyruvate formate lyase activating enzyme
MVWGEEMTVPALMKLIEGDRSFYERTGGGVTLNGGEVMLQWEFASLLLKACREAGIHTCVESALNCATDHVEQVLEDTDLLYADIKHMDPEVHKRLTGTGNEQILKNLRRVVELGIPLVVRTPVVPGYNDDEDNIRKIGAFLRDELGGKVLQYQLLPYRKMGTEKYATLNQPYPMGDYAPPERAVWEANLLRLRDMLADEFGLPATAGSSQKLPGY